MSKIHPTAIISPEAVIGENCEIGPFCIIKPDVKLGSNNILLSNVVLDGNTIIGAGNKFFHSAVIGSDSQDLKAKDEPYQLIIGDNNTFREFCTVNKSATMDEHTIIGSNCLLMAYSHVAHNCQIGNNVIMANAVNLAGHCQLHDFVIVGGLTAIAQFVQIGVYAFVGGASGIKKDIPPYTRGIGLPYKIEGLNVIGLQRKGFTPNQLQAIKDIYRIFYRSGLNISQAIKKAEQLKKLTMEQKIFLDFIKNSRVGINRYH